MYIDSPNFVKRKVLNSKNNLSPNSNSNQTVMIPRQYQFGLQRSLLAQHVANRLNSHDQDFQILEKFRKEAQDLKRQKWLSKKYPKIQYKHQTQHIKSKSQNSLKVGQDISTKKLQMNSAITQQFIQNPSQKQQSNNSDIVHHFERLLVSKEHEIKKKDQKLKKNRQIIQQMSHQIKSLQRQKQFIKKQQDLQVQKINSLIQQMNYKIASNRAIFQQELIKLKSLPIYDSKRLLQQNDMSDSKPLVRNRKKSSFTNLDSDRQALLEPSIYYQLPKISKQSYSNSQPFKNNKKLLIRQNPQQI